MKTLLRAWQEITEAIWKPMFAPNARRDEGAYLTKYVTEEAQRSRRKDGLPRRGWPILPWLVAYPRLRTIQVRRTAVRLEPNQNRLSQIASVISCQALRVLNVVSAHIFGVIGGVILSLAGVIPSHAAFEDIGVGARAPGMGNVFTAMADDVYAIHYNPAGLGIISRPQFTSSYSKLFAGLSDGSNLGRSFVAYAQPIRNGDAGTAGIAWQETKLGGLYAERTVYVSYGKILLEGSYGDGLSMGSSIKYLYRSLGRRPESSNALNRLLATGEPDPVLTNHTKRSAVDIDAGFLYRTPERYSIGVFLTHINEPNIAFSPDNKDKLGLGIKVGFGFRSRWINIGSEAAIRRSPVGSADKTFGLSGEKWFHTTRLGDFGIRSSIGAGSREFKQVTGGASYRINKIQIDYGFIMPMGTVTNIDGTHRVAVTIRF